MDLCTPAIRRNSASPKGKEPEEPVTPTAAHAWDPEPPEVPFKAPEGHSWVKMKLSAYNPCRLTPVLTPDNKRGTPIFEREQVLLGRMWDFYKTVEDLNFRNWNRRTRGDGPLPLWREIMFMAGHDEESIDFLWSYKHHWEIKFTPMCWFTVGRSLEQRWFERFT